MGLWGQKLKSRPLYQTQPYVFGKVKWMAKSERVNLFIYNFVYFTCESPEAGKLKIRV